MCYVQESIQTAVSYILSSSCETVELLSCSHSPRLLPLGAQAGDRVRGTYSLLCAFFVLRCGTRDSYWNCSLILLFSTFFLPGSFDGLPVCLMLLQLWIHDRSAASELRQLGPRQSFCVTHFFLFCDQLWHLSRQNYSWLTISLKLAI